MNKSTKDILRTTIALIIGIVVGFTWRSMCDQNIATGETTPAPAVVSPMVIVAPVEAIPAPTPEPTPYYTVTDEERELMAKTVYEEGNIESLDCQKAIASVIMNRVSSEQFPNTVNDVVYQKGSSGKWQFSVAPLLKNTVPTEENYEAVDYVIWNGSTVPEWVQFFRTKRHFKYNGYVGYAVIDSTYFGGVK